ncbi:uncharacterized protein I206_102548 [Kwoniella pini CBS 10737]|uniref:Methyltransferase domain-containing protein n=1 Tax=Kwoniella pini CBS 10737 TaxID=1296096 RepID=A0A1B9I5Q0_9TREE|nr:uncharacterized protein I206_02899 [Kwoniella pini CBS 10737]OCF50842.1 hypothetical protein I206_02899 [Kwoniella pini CBS 10737]
MKHHSKTTPCAPCNFHLLNIAELPPDLKLTQTLVFDFAGTWAIEVANTHSFSDVLGVDINWGMMTHNTRSRYGNLDFAAVDVEEPLPWPRGSFDVIHVKGLLLEISHYTRLIEKLAMVLRPGGLLAIVEIDPNHVSADGHQLPKCLRQWDACVRSALGGRGVDIDFPSRIGSVIANAGVFASNPYSQYLGVPASSHISRGDVNSAARSGQIHHQLLIANLRKTFSALVEYGYNRPDLEDMFSSCLAELTNPNATYVHRLYAVYATKAYQ